MRIGPGVGECILVHCGDGHWICVDSAHHNGQPWAFSYLSQLGLDPAEALRLIVCTHWHTDHVRGIAELVARCPKARFVCSNAFNTDEFRQVVARFSVTDVYGPISLPLQEVRATFKTLALPQADRHASYQPPVLAQANLPLDAFAARGKPVNVVALSPSAEDIFAALQSFARYFVPLNDPATGLSPIDPNQASVVIHIRAGDDVILLGADLERTASHLTGWNAVVGSAMRPREIAAVFNAHHGSENGHCPEVWRQMIDPTARAVVTPYLRSGLPKQSDLDRLVNQGPTIFATGLPRAVRVRRRAEVEKTQREVAPDLKSFRVQTGIVRLRKKLSGVWENELFGSAVMLPKGHIEAQPVGR